MSLKTLFCLITLTALVGQLSVVNAKPNILLIYTDDHGWADLGAQGVNGDIRTPNIDQLAHDGVRFHRGYIRPGASDPAISSFNGLHQ